MFKMLSELYNFKYINKLNKLFLNKKKIYPKNPSCFNYNEENIT